MRKIRQKQTKSGSLPTCTQTNKGGRDTDGRCFFFFFRMSGFCCFELKREEKDKNACLQSYGVIVDRREREKQKQHKHTGWCDF